MKIKIDKNLFGYNVTFLICLSITFLIFGALTNIKSTPEPVIETVTNAEPLPKVEEQKESFSIKRMGILEVELRDFYKSRVHWNIDVEVKCTPSQKSEVIDFVINSVSKAAMSEFNKFSYEEWSEEWPRIEEQSEYVFQDIVYNKNTFKDVSFKINTISYNSMSY